MYLLPIFFTIFGDNVGYTAVTMDIFLVKYRPVLLASLGLLILLAVCESMQAQEIQVSERQGMFRNRLRERLQAHRQGVKNTPAPTYADLAYGGDPLQRMDVYLPEKKINPAPILVMVHGGGWRRGDKKLGAALQNKLPYYTGKGFVLVSLNYRLVPQVTPIDQAYDIARALAHIQENAGKWGADKNKVVLMGHSAGAHLVTLVTADARQNYGRNALPWLGTISLDGAAIDVERSMTEESGRPLLGRIYRIAFGNDPAQWRAASPMAQLHHGAAPMLLVCSTTRPDQPCRQSEDFVARAKAMGIHASTLPVRMSHGEINADVGLDNDLTRTIDQFMASLGLTFRDDGP